MDCEGCAALELSGFFLDSGLPIQKRLKAVLTKKDSQKGLARQDVVQTERFERSSQNRWITIVLAEES